MKRLNVNEVGIEELKQLPGIGPATAEKIVKARPIESEAELERIVPPSAWLKLTEGQDLVFVFKEGDPSDENKPEAQPSMGEPSVPVQPAQPVMKMVSVPETIAVRRVMSGEQLSPGSEYLCVWNMRHGPQGEAWFPADNAVQTELETWFLQKGMTIKFAHYGPSVKVGTRARGLVNLVLFEILKEKTDGETDEGE